jgi:hypothetical protein
MCHGTYLLYGAQISKTWKFTADLGQIRPSNKSHKKTRNTWFLCGWGRVNVGRHLYLPSNGVATGLRAGFGVAAMVLARDESVESVAVF